MEEIKYMTIYMDNSCEVHFAACETSGGETSRIILSPCGTEFLYRTFSSDNTLTNSFKYRTAYPISIFTHKLSAILRERNRFANDRPFISSVLLESAASSSSSPAYWLSGDDCSAASWSVQPSVCQSNPLHVDYSEHFYVWRSDSKNAEYRLHLSKQVVRVRYWTKLAKASPDDQFDAKCEQFVSKHLSKYAWNDEEFSVRHLPPLWHELHARMLELVDELNANVNSNEQRSSPSSSSSSSSSPLPTIVVKLPTAMPLSCSSTHLHKFDGIEALSEPKCIYLNQTWFKLFYKNKSIEVMCPLSSSSSSSLSSSSLPSSGQLNSVQDYLVSDTLTGRYYTCYSLSKRSGEVEEAKLCIENIPSFKSHLQKTLAYANILLKRIDSVKYLSNYSTCYINKKLEESELCQPVDVNSLCADRHSSSVGGGGEIKRQHVIENIGHFKYLSNNSIAICFADKAKLYMDDYSLNMYVQKSLDKCFVLIYMADHSQHELCMMKRSDEKRESDTGAFENYLSFLEQWIRHLLDTKEIYVRGHQQENPSEQQQQPSDETLDVDWRSLQTHLSQLRSFNYTITSRESSGDTTTTTKQFSPLKIPTSDDFGNRTHVLSVSSLLRENKRFFSNISK